VPLPYPDNMNGLPAEQSMFAALAGLKFQYAYFQTIEYRELSRANNQVFAVFTGYRPQNSSREERWNRALTVARNWTPRYDVR